VSSNIVWADIWYRANVMCSVQCEVYRKNSLHTQMGIMSSCLFYFSIISFCSSSVTNLYLNPTQNVFTDRSGLHFWCCLDEYQVHWLCDNLPHYVYALYIGMYVTIPISGIVYALYANTLCLRAKEGIFCLIYFHGSQFDDHNLCCRHYFRRSLTM